MSCQAGMCGSVRRYFAGGGYCANALLTPFEIFTLASFILSPTSATTEPRHTSRFFFTSAISMFRVPLRADSSEGFCALHELPVCQEELSATGAAAVCFLGSPSVTE